MAARKQAWFMAARSALSQYAGTVGFKSVVAYSITTGVGAGFDEDDDGGS
jgi:hypothetical protein